MPNPTSQALTPTDEKTWALRQAAIRLGILADRMEGCNAEAIEDGRFPTHELLTEARMFEDEARKAADLPARRSSSTPPSVPMADRFHTTCGDCRFTQHGVVQCRYCKLTDDVLSGGRKIQTVIEESRSNG